MSSQQVLNDVPQDQVGAVVQSFCNDGATQVDARKNTSGNFDVTATFPGD